MITSQAIPPEELYTYLQSLPDEQLPAAIHQQRLTAASVEALKAYSTQFYLTEPVRACQIAQEAYRLGQRLPMPAPALGAWALGNALVYTAHYAEAAELLERARLHYLAADQPLAAARLSVGYVGVLACLGQSEKAVAVATMAEALLTPAAEDDPADLERLSGLLNNLGVLHDLHGHYEEALAVYDRQIPLAQRLANRHLLAKLQHNRAYVLGQLNAFQDALTAYAAAETVMLELAAKADLVRLYINLSQLYALYGHYAAEQEIQAKAQALLATLPGMEQARHRLTLLQAQVLLNGQTPPPLMLVAALQTAQLSFHEQGPQEEEALALLLLGHCARRHDDLTAAQQHYEQAHLLVQAGINRLLEHRVLHGLARIAHQQGRRAQAVPLYEQAIHSLEAIRSDLAVEFFRATFLTDKLDLYRDLAGLYIEENAYEPAFAVIERAKARVAAERLTFRLQEETASAGQVDDVAIQTLAGTLQATLVQLEEAYKQREGRSGRPLADSGPVAPPVAAIGELEARVQHLTQQIQQRRPLFSRFSLGQVTSVAALQTTLHTAIFLQFHRYEQQFAVFVTTQEGIVAHRLLAPITEVEQARQRLLAATNRLLDLAATYGRERALRYLPALLQEANDQLQALYTLLFAPLLPYLPANAALIIAPDDTLHYVPFHALYDGVHYLLERHTISYIPSATILELCTRPRGPAAGTLLCGYDNGQLQAVAAEIATLAALFPDAEILVNEHATTDAFTSGAANKALLHLATHAAFRVDNPMLSSLAFADRRLTLAEISRLGLQANLAVLSGCETGRGELQGADLLGLAGGFIGAGVRALLVTLWRIEDASAAQLMTTFYRRSLQQAQSYAAALRQAQLALLQHGRQADGVDRLLLHPAFWAPYILIGQQSKP